ncbi:MAG: MerR family transcriptional regulator [Anaerolineae bacterium]
MPEMNYKSAAEVVSELGIAPQTLKNWSKEFAPFLSAASASPDGSRRFTEDDAVVLKQIKECMAAGMTLEETAAELRNAGYGEAPDEGTHGALAVASAQQGFNVLTDTLRAMIENQQTIQNSLQVNRNLLGVIIQDNFNLKEENAKLRERMLKMEQELSDLKRRDSDYRLYLEQRINRMDAALRAEAGKSLWQRLFGG